MGSIRASTSTKSIMFGFRTGVNSVSSECSGTAADDLWNLYTWKITIGDKTSTFDYLNNNTINGVIHEWWFETRNVRYWDSYLETKVGQTLNVKIEYTPK